MVFIEKWAKVELPDIIRDLPLILFLTLVVLKLVGLTSMPWLWVWSPLWLPIFAMFFCVVALLGVICWASLAKFIYGVVTGWLASRKQASK